MNRFGAAGSSCDVTHDMQGNLLDVAELHIQDKGIVE